MLNWFKSPEKRWQNWLALNKQTRPWHVIDIGRHSFRGEDHVLHFERHASKIEVVNFFPKARSIEVIGSDKFVYQPKSWQTQLVETLEANLGSKLEEFKQELKTYPPAAGDHSAEARGEEWLKTSLVVLERALAGLSGEQRLQTSIFIGTKNGNQMLRIIIFNLDLSFVYHRDKNALQVTCYNRKDAEQFDYSKPDFDGVFAARAYPVFDLAIRLSQQVSEAIVRECLR